MYLAVFWVAVSVGPVAVFMGFSMEWRSMFYFCPEDCSSFPWTGAGKQGQMPKSCFELHAKGSWNSSVLETPEIPGNLG